VGGYIATDPDMSAAVKERWQGLRDAVIARPEFAVNAMSVSGASPTLEAQIRETVLVRFPVSSFELDLQRLSELDNERVFDVLSALPGIGPWTVDMFLMFSLGRLDVLPLGDLALRKSIEHHYRLPDKPALQDYHAIAERWRPYRTISSWYLWAAVD